MGTLEPGVVLADRFRIESAIPFAESRPAYLAIDKETHTKLVVFAIELPVAQALRPGVGISHSHLASIKGIVGFGDVDVLVSEYVSGLTLESFSDGTARLSRVDSVRFTLRMLDALQALHHAGAVHGFIRPAGVLIEPETRARPVLGFAPHPMTFGSYRSPERGEAGPPSVADDAWATAALLYRMLLGSDPPATGVTSEQELEDAGLDEPLLRQALAHGLAADPQKRNQHEQPMRRELARWFADHAGDDHRHSSASMRPPPPLPPHQPSLSGAGPISMGIPPTTPSPGAGSPYSSSTPSGPPSFSTSVQQAVQRRTRKTRVVALASMAVIAGLGAAWIVSYMRSRPKVRLVQTQASAAAPAASSSAFDMGEVAVTGETEKFSGDPVASCVASHLPKDTFKKASDMSWLCSEPDGRTGSDRLRIAIVQAGGGQTTPAMRAYSQLVWYDLGVYAVVRIDCCPDAKPFELPTPGPGCDPMTTVLADLAKAVNASEPYDEPLARLGKVARCETGFKRHTLFRKSGPPGPAEEQSFRDLMKSD